MSQRAAESANWAPISLPTMRHIMGARVAGIVVLATAASLLVGCAPDSPVAMPGPGFATEPGALVGVWTLDQSFDDVAEQPFIAFVQDSSWIASDGCNRVRGTWDLDSDGRLSTTTGPQTLMACAGAQLPLAVTWAAHAEVDGDAMRLFSSSDATVTELVRSTDPLVGPQGFPVGYWVEALTPSAPFLSLSADRTFTGNDGCNELFGTWSTSPDDDERTEFSDVGMTRRACEGVDQWLSQLATARVIAGVMTLESADGTVIGQLTAVGR